MEENKGLRELLLLENIKEDEFFSYKYINIKNNTTFNELGPSFDIDNYLATYLSKNNEVISKTKQSNKILVSIQREREFDFYKNRSSIPLSESFLYTNEYSSKLLDDFQKEMIISDEVSIIVPFISKPILRKIENIIESLNKRNKQINMITTTFDGTGNYVDLEELCKLIDFYSNFKVKVEDVDNTKKRIHGKGYIFKRNTGFSTAILGSSNMTVTGLITGGEWNIKISEFKDQKLFNEIKMAFAKNWNKNLIDLSKQPLLI
ncbi:phospholipase D-like domain-containing protein [Spiroplasma citri]|uniref:Phospholipase D-like domain-containing protein n=1 Tax=Spiroplasma citri TaxID=2133 RepID=A0AAX3SVZ4_SPICI|nr:restriction endonuclease PLD domain-containing protein [Spiroplasma citri]WFG95479.1 phospholipase D-like domain-containing protein [Spiroplasma citri]